MSLQPIWLSRGNLICSEENERKFQKWMRKKKKNKTVENDVAKLSITLNSIGLRILQLCYNYTPVPTSQSDGGGVGQDLSKTFFGKLRLRFIRKEKRM